MDAFLEVYGKMGGQYNWNSGKLIADGSRVSLPLPFLETEVYPGFPTDLQSPLMAVLTTIEGESVIRENIFENRFRLVETLVRMGASIEVKGREARNPRRESFKGMPGKSQGTSRRSRFDRCCAGSGGRNAGLRLFFYPQRI